MQFQTEAYDDIRTLAGIDTRHRALQDVPDRWFENKGYTLLAVRAQDETPLVGVALHHPSPCPIDPTAEMEIKYWVANLDRGSDLPAAFVANIGQINDAMAAANVQRVWGKVPKAAKHLVTLLDPVAKAGACKRVDGAGVPIDAAMDRPKNDYCNSWIYVGDGKEVTDFIRRRR